MAIKVKLPKLFSFRCKELHTGKRYLASHVGADKDVRVLGIGKRWYVQTP